MRPFLRIFVGEPRVDHHHPVVVPSREICTYKARDRSTANDAISTRRSRYTPSHAGLSRYRLEHPRPRRRESGDGHAPSCDLRHEAKQELDVRMDDPDTDEPWLTGSMGSVRLRKDDPRIPKLLEELRAAGVKPLKRVERVHSKKDLQAGWLCVEGCTSMVAAGNFQGQVWNFKHACTDCGAGAMPVAPLVVRFDGKASKQDWSVSVPNGLLIVSAEPAKALEKAKLTGFTAEPVRRPSKSEIDPRYV